MATIVQGGPDLRQEAIQGGVQRGVDAFLETRRRKKQEQKFVDAFKLVNTATSYDDAIMKMSQFDPEIASNPKAMEMLQQQVFAKFPEQETLEVIDIVSRKPETITFPKGRPLSDAELATRGKTRRSSAGIGTKFTQDPKTGKVGVVNEATEEEAAQAAPGALVMDPEEVAPAVALQNAYSNRLDALSRRDTVGTEKRPTEFEQKVTALQARTGIQDRNLAISVLTNAPTVNASFDNYFTKNANGVIYLTDDAAKGHLANSKTITEPALAQGISPEETTKLMMIDAAWNISNDPTIKLKGMGTLNTQATSDFTRLTGLAPGEGGLAEAQQAAQMQLQEGQSRKVQMMKDGKPNGSFIFVKLGGRAIPVARVP